MPVIALPFNGLEEELSKSVHYAYVEFGVELFDEEVKECMEILLVSFRHKTVLIVEECGQE